MLAKIIMPVDQLAELIGAIGVYNGHDFREVQFQDAEGKRIEVHQVSITTDVPGLKIRTAPEDDKNDPGGRLSKLLAQIRGSYGPDSGGHGGSSGGSESGSGSSG
jgi:hypothetical protein